MLLKLKDFSLDGFRKVLLSMIKELETELNSPGPDPEPTHSLLSVFEAACEKAQSKNSKVQNTPTPWKDFSVTHLMKGLQTEYEIMKVRSGQENYEKTKDDLLDVMNLAAFCYLCLDQKKSNIK